MFFVSESYATVYREPVPNAAIINTRWAEVNSTMWRKPDKLDMRVVFKENRTRRPFTMRRHRRAAMGG